MNPRLIVTAFFVLLLACQKTAREVADPILPQPSVSTPSSETTSAEALKSHGVAHIETKLPSEAAANERIESSVRLHPPSDCKHVRISLRGIDGVTVSSIGAEADCVGRRPVEVAFTATVAEGASGYVVVDYWIQREGTMLSWSEPLPLSARGPRAAKPGLGRLERSPDGGSGVIIMDAETRELPSPNR
jgi:hypothetical protein